MNLSAPSPSQDFSGPRPSFFKKLILRLFLLAAAAGLFVWFGFQFVLPPLITQRVNEFVAKEWLTPLNSSKRTDWNTMMLFRKGGFLSDRTAYAHLQKHIHTGVDLQNRKGGGPGEPVYAAATGKVYDVAIQAQGTRVTIQHLLANGEIVYSSYIHVGGVEAVVGRRVTPWTVIARRFTKDELKQYGQIYNHLHFQIHKGVFVREHTVQTSTIEQGKERFYDPETIFHQHYQELTPDWKQWIKDGKLTYWQLLKILFT